MPIQQMMLGAGADSKTYVEDVFSTYLYTATGSALTVNNGIDLTTPSGASAANEGGMVWFKSRTAGGSGYNNHSVVDTVRVDGSGRGKSVYPNLDQAQYSPEGTANVVTSFNSNGYTTGTNANNAYNTQTVASWTIRKIAGLLDIQTWDGNGSAGRQISHDLGCVPGMVFVKSTNNSGDWMVYHREMGNENRVKLNSNTNNATTASWNDTTPTSTYVTLGSNTGVNASGTSYVGYFFAGGESTAATARSVDFDGDDELEVSDSADFDYGSGDFTLELWISPNVDNHSSKLIHAHTSGSNYGPCNLYFDSSSTNMLTLYSSSNNSSFDVSSGTEFGIIPSKSWTHIAVAREGNNIRMFKNGINVATISHSGSMMNPTGTFDIGSRLGTNFFNGKISNFRVVKGTAVYTSSFRPPTEPLANITNTVLLCCNNASTTGSTVVPSGSSITVANGGPTASTDSPFDDPAGFVFGKNGDESLVKCAAYIGNGSATRPEIHLGWEPQFILLKNATNVNNWYIWDSMRGWVTYGNSQYVFPNDDSAEGAADGIDRLPNGFNTRFSGGGMNASGDKYIYWAIRRPDGDVGKAPAAATDVFAQDTANGSSSGPAFDSGFPVDFLLRRMPTGGGGGVDSTFVAYERILGLNYLQTANTSAQSTSSRAKWDLMTGASHTDNDPQTGWMWKRNYGFDVVAYRGATSPNPRPIPHSLGRAPEMIWTKNRDSTVDWMVWHEGLNGGGSNAVNYNLRLNQTDAQNANGDIYGGANNVLPTSTHWTVGGNNGINENGSNFVALLFASVSGISKCGSYTGDDTDDGSHVIDVGFTPRLLIIKRTDGAADWNMFNTLTGFPTSGASAFMEMNTADDAYSGATATVTQTTSGFKLWSPGTAYNANNAKYIYYAHA